MAGSTAAPAFNYNTLNSELAAEQAQAANMAGSGNGAGGQATEGGIGSLLATGNAQNPYAAYVGQSSTGQNEFEVSVPGTNNLYSEDITQGANGATDVSAPVKGGDDSWSQFLTVAGIAAAPILGGLSSAGEFGGAAAAGAAGGTGTAAAGGVSAEDSLAAIGNYGGDSVYGTSAAGGLADASGAGIPSTGLSSLGGSSTLTQLQNLYSDISPYKNAAQGINQVAGLMDGGQASTVGSPQGVSGAGGSNSTLGGLGGLLSLAGGIYGATQASGNAQAGINIADPNQANQAGYLSQLQNLVNNPSSINNNAEFQAANSSALAGVSANMAAGGMNGSGNMASALYQTGLADQQNFYQQDVTNLEQLGGITQAQQGTAAQIQQGIGSNISSLLNGAGQGLSALLGNGSIGSALSSLGSGASSAYNSIFGSSGGSDWGSTASGGEGVTSDFGVSEAASGSGISDDALSAYTDAGNDVSDAFSFF